MRAVPIYDALHPETGAAMRFLLTLLAAALLAGNLLATASLAASPIVEAGRQLDGVWQGDGFALRVDAERAQANVDARRPFAFQRFAVKEVKDGTIVFTIGAELYEATLEGEALTLTGTSFQGERKLLRALPEPQLRH
jgi:hypothetical protein